MKIFVKITLVGGGTYIQPINKVNVIVDEIQESAKNGAIGEKWIVELVKMEQEEYDALPEFLGH